MRTWLLEPGQSEGVRAWLLEPGQSEGIRVWLLKEREWELEPELMGIGIRAGYWNWGMVDETGLGYFN